jgi:hypothetical protein
MVKTDLTYDSVREAFQSAFGHWRQCLAAASSRGHRVRRGAGTWGYLFGSRAGSWEHTAFSTCLFAELCARRTGAEDGIARVAYRGIEPVNQAVMYAALGARLRDVPVVRSEYKTLDFSLLVPACSAPSVATTPRVALGMESEMRPLIKGGWDAATLAPDLVKLLRTDAEDRFFLGRVSHRRERSADGKYRQRKSERALAVVGSAFLDMSAASNARSPVALLLETAADGPWRCHVVVGSRAPESFTVH